MTGKTNTPAAVDSETVLDSAELSEYWSPGRAHDLQLPLAVELLTDLAQTEENIVGWIRKTVDRIQDTTGAERVFFFDAQGSCANDPEGQPAAAVEVGSCIYSVDFDKEPISKPRTKVPMDLLNEAIREDRPIWALDTLKDHTGLSGDLQSKVRGCAVVPLSVLDFCHGVIYLEHRFQPFSITAESAQELVVLLRSVAIRQGFEKLSSENRSLWGDVLQLRKKLKATEALSVPTSLAKAPRIRENESYIGDYSMIIGSSACMRDIFKLLDRIRNSNAPVLINGESGTGKELVANAIHRNSPRSKARFVSENCAALTETLLESELFGYVRGAFTGANRDHKGLFELASGGTLFLDEVGDMSANMQKKLLRAVQVGVIRRVGGKEYIPVDVRIISATNKDLLAEVRKGKFREDLYYRLNVINVKLPPLRERKEDIPELIAFFLNQMAEESRTEKAIHPEAVRLLVQYSWPGNIRELQNEVKRFFALSDERIEVANLSDNIHQGNNSLAWSSFEDELTQLTLREAVEKVERTLIKIALIEHHGNKSQVAKRLRIPKTSLYNKISKYRLDEDIQEMVF